MKEKKITQNFILKGQNRYKANSATKRMVQKFISTNFEMTEKKVKNMERAILKNNNVLVKRSSCYDNLIKEFMSKDFKLTEKNVLKFLRKLHNSDFELQYAHLYTVKTINDIIIGGYFDSNDNEIAISVNTLLNLSKNASEEVVERYKLYVLGSYFHETRHEQQYNETQNYFRSCDRSAFKKVFLMECVGKKVPYEPFISFMEIDARRVTIQRIIDLERRGVYKFNPSSLYFVMLTITQMLNGINAIQSSDQQYEKFPFDCTQILTRIENLFPDIEIPILKINYHSKEFIDDFKKQWNTVYGDFFKNDYSYILKKMFIDTQLSDNFILEMTRKYNINFLDKNNWNNFIKAQCYRPSRYAICDLLLDRDRIAKDKNDIQATVNDIRDYFESKGLEYSKELVNRFSTNLEEHKKFEKWLRTKQQNEVLNLSTNNDVKDFKNIKNEIKENINIREENNSYFNNEK